MVRITPFHFTRLLYGAISITFVLACAFAMIKSEKISRVFNVEVLTGSLNESQIEDIRAVSVDDWRIRSSDELNFGYTDKPVWIKISSENFTDEDNIVDLNFPQLDFVDLFIVNEQTGEVSDHQLSGDRQELKVKKIRSERILFSVKRIDSSSQAYIRIQTDGSNQAPISITSLEEYLGKADFVSSLLHFFLGFSLFATILHGMSLFVYKDFAYLYYIILNVSMSLFLLFHYRIINVYTDILSIYTLHAGVVLSIMCAFYAAIKLVHINFIRWEFERFDKHLERAGFFALIIIVSLFFVDYQLSLLVVFVYLGLIAPFIMYMLIIFVVNTKQTKFIKFGRSIAIAWFIFLIAASAQILGEVGLILDTSYVNHGFLFGCIGIVLSMGLILTSNLELEHGTKLQAEKELAQANQRLYQADKLAVISTMSSGLIHEIKNPLNWTKASVSIALSEVDKNDDLQELLSDSLGGLNQIENIVEGLNWYAKSKTLALTGGVNLKSIIDRTLNLAKSQCEGIVIVNDVSDDIEVYASDNHLAQLFINILSNSIKAIEQVQDNRQGKIQITAGYMKNDSNNKKGRVYLSWLDNGIGIEKEKVARIFDPFFTTSEVNEGIGLGMSIAKQIVDKHEGSMEILSKKNEWTRINIYLNKS